MWNISSPPHTSLLDAFGDLISASAAVGASVLEQHFKIPSAARSLQLLHRLHAKIAYTVIAHETVTTEIYRRFAGRLWTSTAQAVTVSNAAFACCRLSRWSTLA